ncbi:unnamed protein product [Boreogadus saida]
MRSVYSGCIAMRAAQRNPRPAAVVPRQRGSGSGTIVVNPFLLHFAVHEANFRESTPMFLSPQFLLNHG